MKKLIALLLAVTVLFSLALTGCKSETPNTPNNTASDTPSTPDDTGDNEPAASGKDPDRLIKIGFVFSAIVSTDAWAQTSENARLYLEENCQNVETYKVENIAGGADCERVMREYINDGCEIIVGTSFDYVDYMLSLAEEYPDVTFINGSGYETAKNMSVYIAKLEQGRYMTGLLAGKMTKVNKIGYVSSIPFPDPIKQLNGFAVGVAEANPDAEIVTLWANSFNDPTTEAVCANTLIDQGCDLICIDLSSSAVAQVCESRGVMFIGSSVDMREFAPTQQLTSNCWARGWLSRLRLSATEPSLASGASWTSTTAQSRWLSSATRCRRTSATSWPMLRSVCVRALRSLPARSMTIPASCALLRARCSLPRTPTPCSGSSRTSLTTGRTSRPTEAAQQEAITIKVGMKIPTFIRKGEDNGRSNCANAGDPQTVSVLPRQ